MARMLPMLSEDRIGQIESSGEQSFYTWCRDRLPESVLVLHSVAWVDVSDRGGSRDGEADFVICDPEHGVLCVEVKGGRVAFDPETGLWTTTDRKNTRAQLKRSPIAQARDSMYRLLRFMEGNPRWKNLFTNGSPPFAYAAFFPNLSNISDLVSIESPAAILGGRADSVALYDWVKRVYEYEIGPVRRPLGTHGVALIEHLLFPRVDVKPIMATELEDAELRRVELTTDQGAILDVLSRQSRALIVGGAGTGKTLLAVEKVRRLAAAGLRTLLLCYNEALGDHLRKTLAAYPNASAQTYHSLCGRLVSAAKRETGRDVLEEVLIEHPGWDMYDEALPEAMGRALELVDDQFDAIVVDEAQDFRESYWLSVELLLKSGRAGILYIFYDGNQRFYGEGVRLPVDAAPFLLARNCRNARAIHDLAYGFYSGEPTHASAIPGAVTFIDAPSLATAAKAITSQVGKLLTEEKVPPNNISILVAGTPKIDYFDSIESFKLPGGARFKTGGSTEEALSSVVVDTVQRFKGLENDVIFLWGSELTGIERPELLYVGLSRAKTRLYVVSPDSTRLKNARGVL